MRLRSEAPDPVIDREEEAWWNEHAATIEAIWAMALPVRRTIRARYLGRMRNFFLEGMGARPVRCLEVGCGSGWVGRMVAAPGTLELIGLDLAAEQIRLAQENAKADGLAGATEYRCQNLADFTVKDAGSVQCVLIHAILHHLSWQEIRSVLKQLHALGKGTRIFVYEPAYLADPLSELPTTAEARAAQELAGRSKRETDRFHRLFRPSRDRALVKRVEALAVEAHRQGRILSPKEVVFPEKELIGALEEIGEVTGRRLCNFTSVPAAQYATTIRNGFLQRLFCATVLRRAVKLDEELFEKGLIPQVTREYVFMGYECVVR
jgi:2-polyprenyl-3-methyl-5-hydroxy-6-metoxy-1,4-benzoquinol methylase